MQLPSHTEKSDSLLQGSVSAFKLISDELNGVRELINEQLVSSSSVLGLDQLLGSLKSCGGKMIRPGLVLLAGKAIGEITPEHIRIAAIVEIIHNATLLHDDVIDEGKRRRGLPTINSLWGNESAVLLGDFLLSRVFKMCVDLEPGVIKVIAAAAARTCEGELRQIIQRENWQLSESEYIEIITEKSAALFRSCCYLGGLLAGAGERQLEALAEFGHNFGVAFQMTDDLLDIIGDEGKTGKTLGSDVNKNKLTLAIIHLLRTVDESGKIGVKEELNAGGKSREKLVKMLKQHGSFEYVRSRVQEFVAKAIASLRDLEESDAKDALIETARFVAGRAV
jgi:octaprenyl-diphosphate synthase